MSMLSTVANPEVKNNNKCRPVSQHVGGPATDVLSTSWLTQLQHSNSASADVCQSVNHDQKESINLTTIDSFVADWSIRSDLLR